MKRLYFTIALVCLSSMVFAVTYPSKPYKNTSVYNLQAELEVPMQNLNRTSVRAVPSRSVSVRAVSKNFSFAITMQASSNSTLHSYGSGSTVSGGNASVGHANISTPTFSVSSSIPSNNMSELSVPQLAFTTFDSPKTMALRAGGPPSTEGDDPDNPDLWIPVGNGMTTLLLLLIAYVLIIKRKRRAVTLR